MRNGRGANADPFWFRALDAWSVKAVLSPLCVVAAIALTAVMMCGAVRCGALGKGRTDDAGRDLGHTCRGSARGGTDHDGARIDFLEAANDPSSPRSKQPREVRGEFFEDSRERKICDCEDEAVRAQLLVAASVLLAGCSVGAVSAANAPHSPVTPPSTVSRPTPPASRPASRPVAEVQAVDACALLTDEELALLLSNNPVLSKKSFPSEVESKCFWAAKGGTVQLVTMPAVTWVGALPQLVDALDESGQFAGSGRLEALRKDANRIQAGEQTSPVEACRLFSMVFELRGEPAGSTTIVTTGEPGTATGLTCSGQRVTTITLSRAVDASLPLGEVRQALQAAQRRAVG